MQGKFNVTMLKIEYTCKFEAKVSFVWSPGHNTMSLTQNKKAKSKLDTGIVLEITLILVF